MDILSKVQKLCTERNITVKQLERELGFGTSSILRWGQSSPSVDRLVKVANYFGVSMDYLTGETDIRTPVDKLLDGDIVTIQRARESMTDKDKERMLKMIRVCFDYAFNDEQKREYELTDLIE